MALTNRVAVILGATGQLGPAVAKAFADAGARIVLVAPDQDALDALFQQLGYPDSRVMLHAADLRDEEALHARGYRRMVGYVDSGNVPARLPPARRPPADPEE